MPTPTPPTATRPRCCRASACRGPPAADQWGLLTTGQAAAAGVGKMMLSRMVADGELERVFHGVYATPSAAADRNTETRAQWLVLDPHRLAEDRLAEPHVAGVISHATAAAAYNIGTCPPTRSRSRCHDAGRLAAAGCASMS
ncbi:type IV toxin-antitoxin system AbiEi family antitoxin domain-containing protein [Isoptericola halotolerans]|uniref:type IV toxin-antitoxin system AbiEi family antitoxin domain-containing protein n=1 Tax=Isoptericola halotolerans TaxID=300560 RepID=UPI00388E9BBE